MISVIGLVHCFAPVIRSSLNGFQGRKGADQALYLGDLFKETHPCPQRFQLCGVTLIPAGGDRGFQDGSRLAVHFVIALGHLTVLRQGGNRICKGSHLNGVLGAPVAGVHGGPAAFADAHIEHVAGGDRDGLSTLVAGAVLVIAVQENTRLEVFIDRLRLYPKRRISIGDDQQVVSDVAGEGGRQCAARDLQCRQASIIVVPGTAQILAGVQREHDVDLVAVLQPAVCIGKGMESQVGKPIIEGPHPAGGSTALLFRQGLAVFGHTGQIGDVVAACSCAAGTSPGIVLALQDLEHHGHHGVVLAQCVPAIRDGTRAIKSTLGIGRVLHDHMDSSHCLAGVVADLAHVLSVPCGQSHGAEGGLPGLRDLSVGLSRLDCLDPRRHCLFDLY